MHLVAHIAQGNKHPGSLAVIRYGLGLALLRKQGHAHLVAGNAQRLLVVTLAEERNDAGQHLFGFLIVVHTHQYGGFLRQAHHEAVFGSLLLFYLAGLIDIAEGFGIIAHGMIHLGCHAQQYGQATGVIGLPGIFYPFQDVFLGFLGLVGTDIDAGQCVERGAHKVGVAGAFVYLITTLGILGRLLVIGQAEAGERQKAQTIGFYRPAFAQR